jgi:P4 family phage/plasmid primase-like protien
MTAKIFADHAPSYWAAGLPVIPLRPKSKIPGPVRWQTFAAQLPDEATRQNWLAEYADGNMGLPLGPQSKMVALDLDTDDETIRGLIEANIPKSPWVRRGKKGAVWMFRYSEHRTFRIRDVTGASIVELLSKGTQVVLPPSIHPDTQAPYVANSDLLAVAGDLPVLPDNIEQILRDALVGAGVVLSTRGMTKMTEFVAAGGRDSAMVAEAGIWARAVTRGERTLQEALDHIEYWVTNYTEKVVGDTLDPRKARDKVMEFVRRDVLEGKKTLPVGWDAGLTEDEKVAAAKEFGEDFEEWPIARMHEFIDAEFEKHGRGTAERADAIDEVMVRLSKMDKVNPIAEAGLLNAIVQSSGRAVTLGDLRRRLKELKAGELAGNDHTEIAKALIKALEPFGEVRFDGDMFFQWKGSHWEPLPQYKMLGIIAEDFGSLVAAKKHNDHRGVLKTAQMLVKHGLKDAFVEGVNFANGFLTLDLQLLPHDPKFGATYVLPYRYMAEMDGAAHRWNALLADIWGDEPDYIDRVQALRQAMATTIFGVAYRYSRAICLHGLSHTGKSTVMDIMQGLLPEGTVCNVPPQKWDDKFLPAEMYGKLLNRCGELSESELIAGDLFKQIVEGAQISAQFKNRDIFKMRPLCAHWFASNHLPRSRDTSAGFTRRWLFLDFNKVVTSGQKIEGLAWDILAEEREAIAAWAVGAIKTVQAQHDYTLPRCHTELVNEVATQNNSVRFFLQNGGVIRDAKAEIQEKDLFANYWTFCKMNANSQPVSMRKFRLVARELEREMGFRIRLVHREGGEVAWYDGLKVAA